MNWLKISRGKEEEVKTSFTVSSPTNYRNRSLTALFGVPLSELMADERRTRGLAIPIFVEQVCFHIEQVLLDIEGIFRKVGTVSCLDQQRGILNDGGQLNFFQVDEFVICDLLKLFLRELPNPLLTCELYYLFLAKAKIAEATKTKMEMREMLCALPDVNRTILKRVVLCLKRVQERSQNNKMTARNLGTIFGPNLLRPPPGLSESSTKEYVENYALINDIIISTFIDDYDAIFADVNYEPYYLCYVKAIENYSPQPTTSSGMQKSSTEGAGDQDTSFQLNLKNGDIIRVTEIHESGWWLGELQDQLGYFPASYCCYLDGLPCESV